MKELEALVRRLDRIAQANKDEFKCSLEVDASRAKGLLIAFRAVEQVERHHFLSGHGATVEEAVADAVLNLKDACKDWGYKVVA